MTMLYSFEEFNARIESPDLVLVDCRSALGNPGYGREQYLAGHIPGAVFADVDADLADPPGRRGRHPLPSRERFQETLRRLGVNHSSHIVAYDDANCMFAARFWWMVRWAGHAEVALLDGGYAAWLSAGSEPTAEVIHPEPGDFTLADPLTRQVDCHDIERGDLTLIDARAHERYRGEVEPMDHKAGHIPGAECMPFLENVDADGKFIRSSDRFHPLARAENVVCYCGSGVTAAHNVFAMILAGLREPALYPGSWSEWIEDPSHPVAP